MILTIAFPEIDPIIVQFGGLAIRWYGLAYVVGLLLGWRYCLRLAARPPHLATVDIVDGFFVWAVLGVVAGGRLGSVLFYNLDFYLSDPLEILFIWRGGMSFHGGLLGVLVAMILHAKRQEIPLRALSDIVCAAAPIGLFFGRVANFINSELYGRPTDVSWAMVFPADPLQLPRHPSQLYEAGLEGLVLFCVLYFLIRRGALQRPGLVSGGFLAGYGLARMAVELFRQPDANIGFLLGGATMGQLLSLPMLLAGVGLIVWALIYAPPAGKGQAPPP